MSVFSLRDYQLKAAEAVMREFEEQDSTLVVLPTGGGKTVLFADIIRRFQPKRSLVLCHREELIFQAVEKIERFAGLGCEIEMAGSMANTTLFGKSPVVVATIQTLISGIERRRMTRFSPSDFGLIICDEAHHCPSASWKMVLDYFKQNPYLKVLGVTATPDRTDEEALGQIFKTVAFDYEILDAINDGWLVPIRQQMVTVQGLDFSGVRTTCGDLNGADLAKIMEAEEAMQGVASAAIEIVEDRRTIIFTASVKQAETVSAILNRHKPGMCEWVCGKTDKDARRATLDRFSKGLVQVVANCGVLTEGFDNPGVEVIVMARPTKSRSLYAQMAGRATRPLPGMVDECQTANGRKAAIWNSNKPHCEIVDFTGNSGKHKLMSTADILGGSVSEEAVALAVRKAKEKGGPVFMSEELFAAQEELDKQADEARQREAARKARLVAKASFTTVKMDPFNAFDLVPDKARGWDSGHTLTEKQHSILMKQGINPDTMPYGQAKQLLNETFRRWNGSLATMKQCQLLKKHGYETRELKMSDASKMIDALAKNGWRRPQDSVAAQAKG